MLAISLAGCGRYADFELPPPSAGRSDASYSWEFRPDPVIARGSAVDVLNPSVVRFKDRYWNLYSEFDGAAWHTSAATSHDGFVWEPGRRVLSPDRATWEGGYIAANGSAIVADVGIWYWYQAGDPVRIGLAKSADGARWTRHPAAVLETGPLNSWDERGVADPYVIHVGDQFYMFYLGQDRARRQRLGVACSRDGVKWTKLRSNPVLELGRDGEFDEQGLGEPAVWAGSGRYWMLYTGRDRHEVRRIGLAESPDGVHWTRSKAAPVFAGDQPWNSKVVCDPTVEPIPDGVRVWYGGGNVARPDERLNGQIGYAFLRAVTPASPLRPSTTPR